MPGGSRSITVDFEGDASDLVRASQQAERAMESTSRSAEDMAESMGDTASRSSQVAGGLGDLGGAISQLGGPFASLGAGMEALGPSIMGVTGAADLMEATLKSTTITTIKNTASTVASTVAQTAAKAATVAWTAVQWLLNAALSANPIALVVIAIAALVAGIIVAYNTSDTFRSIVQNTWTVIQNVIVGAWNVISPLFDLWILQYKLMWQGAQILGGVVADVFGVIVRVVDGAADGVGRGIGKVRGYVDDAVGFITGIPGQIAGVVSSVYDKGSAIASAFYQGFKDIASGASDAFLGGLKAIVNVAIIDPINLAIDAINLAIRAYNSIPLVGNIDTISHIPRLARGGVVTGPTLALIGERGPEKVIPLTDPRAARYGGSGGPINITINVPPTANPAETGRAVAGVLRSYFAAGGRLTVPA